MKVKDLWAAQLAEWPDSIRLSIHQVYSWCDEGPTVENKKNRWALVALALQWPAAVFYRTSPTGYRGFRYGVLGHEYMSGFTALEI